MFSVNDRVLHHFGFGEVIESISRIGMCIVRFDEERHGERDFRVCAELLESETITPVQLITLMHMTKTPVEGTTRAEWKSKFDSMMATLERDGCLDMNGPEFTAVREFIERHGA